MQGALVRWRELSLAQREEHGLKWVVKRQRGGVYEKRRKWMNSRSIVKAFSSGPWGGLMAGGHATHREESARTAVSDTGSAGTGDRNTCGGVGDRKCDLKENVAARNVGPLS